MSEPVVIYEEKDVNFTVTKLVDENGEFINNCHIRSAIDRANRFGLNLVCFSEPCGENQALCKILDYNKWKYNTDKAKKKNESGQSHKNKEFRFSTNIGQHDIEHKCNQMKSSISHGDNVVVYVQFNRKNEKQKNQALLKIVEVMDSCKDFAKEVSRKDADNGIYINVSQLPLPKGRGL